MVELIEQLQNEDVCMCLLDKEISGEGKSVLQICTQDSRLMRDILEMTQSSKTNEDKESIEYAADIILKIRSDAC